MRLAVLSAVLAAAVIGGTFVALNVQVRRSTHRLFADELSRNQRTLVALQTENRRRLVLTSALLARHGFTASPKALEAPRGYAQVVSTKYDWKELTEELGERFEISFNTYKPFACGIVKSPLLKFQCVSSVSIR